MFKKFLQKIKIKNKINFFDQDIEKLSLNQLDKISGGANFLMFLERHNVNEIKLCSTNDTAKRDLILFDFPNLSRCDLDNLHNDKILVVRYKEEGSDMAPVCASIEDKTNINGIDYTDR